MKYWEECLADSFEEHGIFYSPEQLSKVAKDIEGAFESYHLAYPLPENPLVSKLKETENKLKEEQDKVVCPACKGTGQERLDGPAHYSISQCYYCGGNGKVSPSEANRISRR